MLGPHAPAQVCRVLAMTRRPYKDPASRTHLLTFVSYPLTYFLRRVLPGEELVFDYGEQYWTKERNLRPLP